MSKRVPLTPFLVTTLFVLVSYRELQPFVKWEELVGVWGLSLLIAGALYWVVRRFVPEQPRAGLLATLLIMFICFYGDFDGRLKRLVGWCGLPELARARYLAPVLLAAFVGTAWGILRAPWPVGRVKEVLRVFVGGMVVATVLLNHLYPSKFISRRDRPRDVDEHGPFTRTNSRPDIYFIVLDAYTSAENLQRFWGHDNTPFTSFLESNGFFVVRNAGANYDQTPRCMASALNMAHITQPPADLSPYGRVNRMYEIIDGAAAPRKLQEIGYDIINLSLFDLAGQEQHYRLPFLDYVSLSGLMLQKSLYGYADSWWQKRHLMDVHFDILARVKKLAAEPAPAPRFIYAHILAPHWPYFFNRHGRRPDPVFSGDTAGDYLEQLLYVNQLVTNLVMEIRSKSKEPPIIIIQGDHGYRALTAANQREGASRILNAYHLPGGRREWLHAGITPVNTFRMLFNQYFGAHYPLLPDTYHSKGETLPAH